MRVFVTGASGWIGRGLVPELIAAGHEVTGLARSDAAAEALQAAGAEVRRGRSTTSAPCATPPPRPTASSTSRSSTTSPSPATSPAPPTPTARRSRPSARPWPAPASRSSSPPASSACSGSRPESVATERDGLAADAGDREVPISGANGRMANAHYTLALAGRGVRSSVVRLPPATHGNGDNGFIPVAIGFAREKGAAAYVGDGANRWPSVHRDDAARLFRLALESAPAGSVLHAVGDEGVPIREVAEIFAAHLAFPRSPSPRAGRGVRRLPRRLLGIRRPRLGTDHPRPARVGADPPGTDRRPQGGPLLRLSLS
jgi:nucleoside-diphosphate-sugar epimerase